MTNSMARRPFQLVEPVAVVTYMADEPTQAVMALGAGNVWDAYFAGRAAPLGRDAPPEVVHALFYNFADGEVARHIPRVWDRVTPEAANAERERGSVAALRRILGDLADVVDGMRTRGVIGADGWLTAAGRQTKERVESLTDELAAPAYDILEPDELDELVEDLEPLAAVLDAAGSQ